jgi:hypothetical protein
MSNINLKSKAILLVELNDIEDPQTLFFVSYFYPHVNDY